MPNCSKKTTMKTSKASQLVWSAGKIKAKGFASYQPSAIRTSSNPSTTRKVGHWHSTAVSIQSTSNALTSHPNNKHCHAHCVNRFPILCFLFRSSSMKSRRYLRFLNESTLWKWYWASSTKATMVNLRKMEFWASSDRWVQWSERICWKSNRSWMKKINASPTFFTELWKL
jgi:hypothetical protein